MVTNATVHLWGKTVGAVIWEQRRNLATFEYDPAFIRLGLDLSPFVMSTKARSSIHSFPALSKNETFNGLPGLLADCLPDTFGNALINSWMARNGRSPNTINPVEKLCFLGNRAMGALEFQPAINPSDDEATSIELNDLIRITKQILEKKKSAAAKISEKDERSILEVLKVGTSAGGARAKAVIAYNPKTKEVRTGQASAPDGFEHWLIKFDGINDGQIGVTNGFGRVEMAYYRMAKDAGLEMNDCRLLEENGRAHFMTRRFDRIDNKKIHMQSLCAMRHFDFNQVGYYGYEQVFETMRMLNLPYTQQEQLFKRMVFNVLARNCDDHTKNIAFLMDQQGNWSLSPAYDICHAYRPNSPWVSQHSLTINGKTDQITRQDLLTVSRSMDIKKGDSIIDQIAEVVANWKGYAEETKVPSKLVEEIDETLLPGFEEFKKVDNIQRKRIQ
jgi:serine/threonine-protein kinase HipA